LQGAALSELIKKFFAEDVGIASLKKRVAKLEQANNQFLRTNHQLKESNTQLNKAKFKFEGEYAELHVYAKRRIQRCTDLKEAAAELGEKLKSAEPKAVELNQRFKIAEDRTVELESRPAIREGDFDAYRTGVSTSMTLLREAYENTASGIGARPLPVEDAGSIEECFDWLNLFGEVFNYDDDESVISLCWCKFIHDIDAPPLQGLGWAINCEGCTGAL
jgi:hypothetical protein